MITRQIKSRTCELEISEQNPFCNDKLNRAKLGDILTDIVSYYGNSGCVMALNGEWGSGKTTFVRMWRQQLKNKGYKTLYFNAWSSDYTNDPLIAMIAELKDLSPDKEIINKIASGAARIGISALNGFLKKTIGETPGELWSIVSEATEIGKEYLKEFSTQKATIEEFKRNIQTYVADNAAEHPVVFFVDELDRCNPHYAVTVLERIKHLFEIPNIIILAINKKELENAIQGYFGSANINSNEYLRRFIDIEYTIPKPDIENYCDYLYNEYGFDDFFEDSKRQEYFRSDSEIESFQTVALRLCDAAQTNLRQMDRIYAYARLSLMQFAPNTYLIPNIFFLLCFWKVVNPTFYKRLRNKDFTIQELLTKEDILPHSLLTKEEYYNDRNFIHTIADLLYCYDITNLNGNPSNPTLIAIQGKSNNRNEYQLDSRYIDKDCLNEALDFYYTRHFEKSIYGLRFIFNKIDLLESFRV